MEKMNWKIAKLIVWNEQSKTYHIENHYRSEISSQYSRIFEMDCSRLIEKQYPYAIDAFSLISNGHTVLYTEA